jgi:hypothetical protein
MRIYGQSPDYWREKGFSPAMQTDWYAESLRLTFFVPPGWTQRALFTEIAGVPAVEQVSRPQMQVFQETGNAGGAFLTLSQHAGRVDFVLSDTPQMMQMIGLDNPPTKPFFWAGELNAAMSSFAEMSRKAAPVVGRALRVAFAVTAIKQTETARDAMILLKDYLPTVDYNPHDESDLVFQINRPHVGSQGHKINRLGRWQTIQSGIAQIFLGAASPLVMPAPRPSFGARAYADISTDVGNSVPIEGQALTLLTEELRLLAGDIVARGDRR